MEISLIIICGTIIIITVFIFLLFKTKSNGELEWDTKNGKIKLKRAANNVEYNLKSLEEIKEQNETRVINTEIDKMAAYKDFIVAILYANTEIRINIYKFLRENNITEMGEAQYNLYAREKVDYIFNKFNEAITNSKNTIVKSLTLDFLLSNYKIILKNHLLTIFQSVYNNHKELNLRRADFIKSLTEETDSKAEIMSLLFSKVYKDINEALNMDENLLNEAIYDISNTLIGLWHDYLLELKKYKIWG